MTPIQITPAAANMNRYELRCPDASLVSRDHMALGLLLARPRKRDAYFPNYGQQWGLAGFLVEPFL
jgi:hypothetical protein